MSVNAVELLVQGKSNVVMCELDGVVTPVDISWALIADRMYKNKLKAGDLDKFTKDEIAAMEAMAEKRRAEIKRLYAVANDMAF
jgi:hypothetical protein